MSPQIGEFVLTHPDIRIPERGKIYSFNEANRWAWDKPLQEYVTAIQLVSLGRKKNTRRVVDGQDGRGSSERRMGGDKDG